jgi:alpha-glucosidase
LEWAVQKYRDYQIPLDGLHVDVDIQKGYHTFTIDTNKFPDPQGMFKKLRDAGVKCSTNITPIISNRNTNDYNTYQEAINQGFLILDRRYDPNNPDSRRYQLYAGGNEYQPNDENSIEGYNSGTPYIGEVYYGNDAAGNQLGTSGHYADLGRADVRRWWGTQYQYLFDMGLEMVWQDMTTPAIRDYRGDMKGFPFRLLLTDTSLSDQPARTTPAIKIWNLYSYNLHKATYHGLNNLEGRNGKRNFIIGRGCFTGSHRWAGLWTGDNSSDWDFLRMNVSQALSLGMCGLDINGQDIGGFECGLDNGKWASPELLIRWTAAGAFLPWFRNHYVRKGRKEFQEPFMYVEWFDQYQGGVLPEPQDLYRMVLPICKHYIELRYRLMQLFYDALFSNTLDGLPICRPLFLNDPDDKTLYNDGIHFLDDEFFVGKDLLVAPVLVPQTEDENGGRRDVYLPAGNCWYNFMDNKMPLLPAVEGGTIIRDFDAGLRLEGNHINFVVPLFVRAGAIIPTIELEQYVGQRNAQGQQNPITLNVYPGTSGEYTLYLDDGTSRDSAPRSADPQEDGGDPLAEGKYREVHVAHSTSGNVREISIERRHDEYSPMETFLFVAILHDPSETRTATGCLKNVKIDGKSINQLTAGSPEQRSEELLDLKTDGWYYNENINVSFIKIFDDSPTKAVSAEYN